MELSDAELVSIAETISNFRDVEDIVTKKLAEKQKKKGPATKTRKRTRSLSR